MKFLVVLAIFVGVCTAQQQRYTPTQTANDIVVTRSENENNGDGTFRWVSELSDGSKHEQSGYLKAGPDPEKPIQVIQGVISYYAPDGQLYELSYISDENGFQPQGAHVPKLPAQNVQSQQQQRPQPNQYQQQAQQQYQPQQQQRNQFQQQYRPRPQAN